MMHQGSGNSALINLAPKLGRINQKSRRILIAKTTSRRRHPAGIVRRGDNDQRGCLSKLANC